MLFTEAFLLQRFLKQTQAEQVNTKQLITRLLPKDTDNTSIATQVTSISSLIDTSIGTFINDLAELDDDDYNKYESVLSLLIKSITRKYPKEFEQLTSSCNKEYDKIHPFQQSIFTQPDMFSIILQFLDLNSLQNCNLVDSNWLINSFAPKPLLWLDLSLFKGVKSQFRCRQVGKRFQNAKNIVANFWDKIDFGIVNKIFVYLSNEMMETLEASISNYDDDDSVEFVQSLHKYTSQLKLFVFFSEDSEVPRYNSSSHKTLGSGSGNCKPVALLNCQEIQVNGGLFPMIITNKCRKLSLTFECLLDYKSNYFDVSNVEEVKLCRLQLIDINDNMVIGGTKNSPNNTVMHSITDERITQLANGFCNNVKRLGIDQLTETSLRLWKEIYHQHKKIGKQVSMITCIEFMPELHEVNEIIENQLAMSELTVDSNMFSDDDDTDIVSVFGKLLDYVLKINNELNKNKLQFLNVLLPLSEELLESIINSFSKLMKENKMQFEKDANALEAIQMPFDQSVYKYYGSGGFTTVKIASILRLLDIIVNINAIKLNNDTNSNSDHNCQVKKSTCSFEGSFRVNGDEFKNNDTRKLFFKKIQSMMQQEIPISVKISWNTKDVIDVVGINESDIKSWYRKPLCNEKYGQPKDTLQMIVDNTKGDTERKPSIKLSNFECHYYGF